MTVYIVITAIFIATLYIIFRQVIEEHREDRNRRGPNRRRIFSKRASRIGDVELS